jgi:DNA-directed RNA polymerase specialized sigma24 family protein
MRRTMHQMPPIVEKRILRPAQTALSLELVNKMDLLRIKTIARIYARGLPPDGVWEDMLQEALTRVLTGSRRQPEGVPMVAFVAGILRSLRADYWRRAKRESSDDKLRFDRQRDESLELDLVDPRPGPERALNARQQIALIKLLFADDPAALTIIDGLGGGLTAEQIRVSTGLSKTAYDSARRRMRRRVLREGLTCEPR